MIKNTLTKGYALAILSAFTAANTYFTSKHILNLVTVFQFGILWFGFALIYNSAYIIFTRKFRKLFILPIKAYFILALFAFIEIIATTSFFIAIKLMENPAIVSFLGNISPALVTLLAMLLLKERFNLKEGIGVIIAITGVFFVSFRWSFKLDSLFVAGSEYVLLSAMAVSINIIIAKKFIHQLQPELLSITRVISLLLFSLIALLSSTQKFGFQSETVLFAMYGAFIGPFLGACAQYYALKYIPVSKVVIIQSSKSFMILLMAFVLLGLWPLWIQIAGGVLTIAGIIMVTVNSNTQTGKHLGIAN